MRFICVDSSGTARGGPFPRVLSILDVTHAIKCTRLSTDLVRSKVIRVRLVPYSGYFFGGGLDFRGFRG